MDLLLFNNNKSEGVQRIPVGEEGEAFQWAAGNPVKQSVGFSATWKYLWLY